MFRHETFVVEMTKNLSILLVNGQLKRLRTKNHYVSATTFEIENSCQIYNKLWSIACMYIVYSI